MSRPWLFFVGLVLLVVGLAIPSRPDQTLKQRVRDFARHLPFLGWLRRRDKQ